MAQTIRHTKVSGVADGTDPGQIQPSDWNADHEITGAITKGEVGLGNVDNTSDADKPVSTAQAAAIAAKANVNSPVFTGDPKAPTPATGDNDTSIATTAFVKAQGYQTGAPPSMASTVEVLSGVDTTKTVNPDALAALWEQGATIAAASVISLGEGGYFNVTGTTSISDIDFATSKAGRTATLVFTQALTLVHSANLILPGAVNLDVAAGDVCTFTQEAGDIVRLTNHQTVPYVPPDPEPPAEVSGYRLKRITYIYNSSTWTRDADVTAVWVRLQAAGGGGGGAATSGGANNSAGGGGGGGEYGELWLEGPAASYSVSIGNGGNGGSSGGGNGSPGGNSAFGGAFNVVGGDGGGGGAAVGAVQYSGTGGGGGGGGSGADLQFEGQPGTHGHMDNTNNRAGGFGGHAMFGVGARGPLSNFNTTSTGGGLGKGYGGGGAGGISSVSSGATGGAGADGICVVHEYVGAVI